MSDLYKFETYREEICGECLFATCDTCPVEQTYRKLLDEEYGEDFHTPMTVHSVDSKQFQENLEKWLARRHGKGDFKAKARKQRVIPRKKDTGYLKDNMSTTRRKIKMGFGS